ncbi:hypothetical protein EVAR_94073_1 [Eumeta japonica]|uniref:Uncharacterized protein n=1 Tax=Eumeta variegata TaxID=151549 RepID=A0A4C1V6C8_EUMVA|nr:hypothetical protein EVAR_94073_1 [Eumeta japonica]
METVLPTDDTVCVMRDGYNLCSGMKFKTKPISELKAKPESENTAKSINEINDNRTIVIERRTRYKYGETHSASAQAELRTKRSIYV